MHTTSSSTWMSVCPAHVLVLIVAGLRRLRRELQLIQQSPNSQADAVSQRQSSSSQSTGHAYMSSSPLHVAILTWLLMLPGQVAVKPSSSSLLELEAPGVFCFISSRKLRKLISDSKMCSFATHLGISDHPWRHHPPALTV